MMLLIHGTQPLVPFKQSRISNIYTLNKLFERLVDPIYNQICDNEIQDVENVEEVSSVVKPALVLVTQ